MTTLRCCLHVLAALCIGLCAGCAATQASAPAVKATPAAEARIIVKFSPHVRAPSSFAFVETLSRDVSATLTYVRPLSGGAHVFSFNSQGDGTRLEAVLAALRKRPDVIYAEPDRLMKPF